MKITVKNGNALKAFKLLNRKLYEDGFFNELKDNRFHKTRSEKKREKHELAVLRRKKEQQKRSQNFDKFEQRQLQKAKRTSKNNKRR